MNRVGLLGAAMAVAIGGIGLFSQPANAAAQTCIWTGGASDVKFSTAANWSNCSSSVPQSGDIIKFLASTFINGSNKLTNDLATNFSGVVLDNDLEAWPQNHPWVTSLNVADGGYVAVSNTGSSEYDLRLNVGTDYDSRGTLQTAGDLEMRGGAGGWFKLNVPGSLRIVNGDESSHVNLARDVIGSVEFVSGSGSVYFGDQKKDVTSINRSTPILVRSAANVDLKFWSACAEMAMMGGNDGSMCITTQPTTYNYSGSLSVEGSATFKSDLDTTVNMTGQVIGADKIVRGNVAGTLNVGGAKIENPVKETSYVGEKPSENITVVENETAILPEGASRGLATVYDKGVLKGLGFLNLLIVRNGGIIAPGMSPGCISADTMILAGEYQFEVGGVDVCTGYDQIKITNEVATRPVSIGTGATLVTARYNDYTPKQGEVYTIIDVAGGQAVDGTFADLPEGATFDQNGITFKISYVGGDGNDVTLTVMNQPTVPNTGFEKLSAQPLLIATGTILTAGALFFVARRQAA